MSRPRRLKRELAALREELAAQAPMPVATGDAREPTMARVSILHTLNPNYLGQEVEIRALPFVIGREACELTITGDRQISREHACINYENGGYTITAAGKCK